MNDKRKRNQSSSDYEDHIQVTKPKKKKNLKRKTNDLDEAEKAEKLKQSISSDIASMCSIIDTHGALKLIKSIFPSSSFNLAPIIHQHQIYSMVENRTRVDREIEDLKNSNLIRLFRCDSMTDDIAICYTDDFKLHLKEHLFDLEKVNTQQIIKNSKTSQNEFKKLIERFQNEILRDVNEMSISQSDLKKTFHLTEHEITILVQTGLLTIKNASSWYFAIPFVGNFRRDFIGARKSVVNLLRKKKFQELTIEELYRRNSKQVNQIGVIYLITDLLGRELVRKIDSPMGFVVKLN